MSNQAHPIGSDPFGRNIPREANPNAPRGTTDETRAAAARFLENTETVTVGSGGQFDTQAGGPK